MTNPATNSHPELPKPFGLLLKELRQSRGLSQRALGKRCGMRHATISRLESGERMPSRKMVNRLVRAMSLDYAETAKLFAAAGFWPTVASNGRQSLLATLAHLLEDRRLDEATREQAVQRVKELVAWLSGQLGKENGA